MTQNQWKCPVSRKRLMPELASSYFLFFSVFLCFVSDSDQQIFIFAIYGLSLESAF